MQLFSDCRSEWSKEPQWENECDFFWQCFLLVFVILWIQYSIIHSPNWELWSFWSFVCCGGDNSWFGEFNNEPFIRFLVKSLAPSKLCKRRNFFSCDESRVMCMSRFAVLWIQCPTFHTIMLPSAKYSCQNTNVIQSHFAGLLFYLISYEKLVQKYMNLTSIEFIVEQCAELISIPIVGHFPKSFVLISPIYT